MERQGSRFRSAGTFGFGLLTRWLMEHAGSGHTQGEGTVDFVAHYSRREEILKRQPVNLAEKLDRIHDHWNPRIVGELNGQHVKLAKVKGEFVWHHHENEDELFFVLKGELRLEFRDGSVALKRGEMFIVPKGTEHRPVAREEVHLLMFEPTSTLNTGNLRNERTVEDPQRL